MKLISSLVLVLLSISSFGQTWFANPGIRPNWFAMTPNGIKVDSVVWFPTYREIVSGDTAMIAFDSVGKGYPIYKSTIKAWSGGGVYTGQSPTTVTVGGLASGTDISNQTYTEIIESIVSPYVDPSISLFSVSGQPLTVEVGTLLTGSRMFNWNVINNSGQVNYVNIFDVTNSSYIIQNTPNDGVQSVIITPYVLTGHGSTQQWRLEALDATKGTSIHSSPITVTSRFYRFFGPTTVKPQTSSDVRSLPQASFRTGGGNINLNTGSTLIDFAVVLPPGVLITNVVDQTASNANITSQYIYEGVIPVEDAGGNLQNYNLYFMRIGTPYSTNHVHIITHN